MTPLTRVMATVDEAMDFQLPSNHWMMFVSDQEYDFQEKVWRISTLHPIGSNGVVACDCLVRAVNHDLYKASRTPYRFRKHICPKGMDFYRHVVGLLVEKAQATLDLTGKAGQL